MLIPMGYTEAKRLRIYLRNVDGTALTITDPHYLEFFVHSPQTWSRIFTPAEVLSNAEGSYIDVTIPSPASINTGAIFKLPEAGLARYQLMYSHPSGFNAIIDSGILEITRSI